ncbi:MAG: hypothetical protein ACOY16_12950 [Chloroflexota bacterium]
MANACTYLELHPRLERSFPFLRQEVRINAFCSKTMRSVPEPHIGCGECHPLPPAFTEDNHADNPVT